MDLEKRIKEAKLGVSYCSFHKEFMDKSREYILSQLKSYSFIDRMKAYLGDNSENSVRYRVARMYLRELK